MFKTIIESSKLNYIIIFAHFRMNENEKKLLSVKKYAINFNTELLLGDVPISPVYFQLLTFQSRGVCNSLLRSCSS